MSIACSQRCYCAPRSPTGLYYCFTSCCLPQARRGSQRALARGCECVHEEQSRVASLPFVTCLHCKLTLSLHLSCPFIQHGRTALHKAAQANHVESIKLLVLAGADVNAQDEVTGSEHLQPYLHLQCTDPPPPYCRLGPRHCTLRPCTSTLRPLSSLLLMAQTSMRVIE